MDPAGNGLAVWYQSDGTRNNIWSNRYTLGIGWGTAEKIESNDNNALDPRAALDAIGNALVVWRQADSIWSNRFTTGTGWGIANEIVSGSGVAYSPEVAADSFGNTIAVWNSYDGVENSILANRYVIGVGWGTASTIGIGAGPQVAINPDGDTLVVWQQGNSSQTEIWSKRFTAVVGWEATEQIATGLQSVRNLQVVTDAIGGATAVWASVNTVWLSVNYNQYVEGIGWGSPREITKIILREGWSVNGQPQIASNSNGKAVTVWLQESSLWASYFEG